MTLATFSDANVHLDGKKIEFLNAEDAAPYAGAADDIVRGALFDRYGDVVSDWDESGTPSETPGLVRRAAAFLMAHFKYASVYSEETQDPNSYAVRLRQEAMAILDGLAAGTLELIDYTPPEGDSVVNQPSFWPDDTDVDFVSMESNVKFTMGREF